MRRYQWRRRLDHDISGRVLRVNHNRARTLVPVDYPSDPLVVHLVAMEVEVAAVAGEVEVAEDTRTPVQVVDYPTQIPLIRYRPLNCPTLVNSHRFLRPSELRPRSRGCHLVTRRRGWVMEDMDLIRLVRIRVRVG